MKQKFIYLAVAVLFSFFLIPGIANARILSFRVNDNVVSFKLTNGLMQLKICSEDIVEVKYTILNSFSDKRSLVVNNNWPKPVAFNISNNGENVLISTKRLKITINKSSNAITYYDIKGNQLCSEYGHSNKVMQPSTVAGIATYTCQTQFNSPANEALFGLGCHPLDSLSINYKGRNQTMAIQYLTGAIPVLLSTRGYGLLWDNYSASNFYGGEANNTRFKYVSESGKQIDYYFFYGPGFDHIIDLYRTTTGKAPMFPKWVFGLFQSQDKYTSQSEILSVKDKYRANHIPLDAIVQDWYYWEPLPIGSHVMNPQRYPDPKAMIDELHKDHVHAMISIWPVLGKGTPNFDALKANGFLTDITWDNFVTHTFDTYYDAHNPSARKLYWQQARDSLIRRYGWDAWWVDQCEPDNGLLLDARRKSEFSIGKGIDYFNTYSLEHTKGLYSGWRNDIYGKRAFFLTRQAFAGQQRNATTLWSSDISCTFTAFKQQIPQGINACTSGLPYWTSDIGGYHYNWAAPDWSKPENQELFTRWFQFGAFCPIFRIHGKGERALFSNNWSAETKAILLRYDKLRYKLLPYIYSLAGKVTTDNYTIMRSLAFDFRNDSGVYNIPDQYMFGPAFMVCPVTEQLYSGSQAGSGKKTRNVYLPRQVRWYNFWNGESVNGGKAIDADAPIDIIPLFVKAGSIIPVGPSVEYATQTTASPTEIRVYPGADGKFTIYEDENDNYNYEKGEYAVFNIFWNDKQKVLTIGNRKGKFKGMAKSRKFNIVLVRPGHGVADNTTLVADKQITYGGRLTSVKL